MTYIRDGKAYKEKKADVSGERLERFAAMKGRQPTEKFCHV